MNKTGTLIGIVVVLAIVVIAAFLVTRASSNEEMAVRDTVTSFGASLKNVSLLAPTDQVAQEMQESYAPYVAPNLLATWESAPMSAPGRFTSSPWPDSITIGSLEKSGGAYTVTGSVVEITSTGPAGSYPVSLTLTKTNGSWLITEFSGYPAAQVGQ